MKIPTKTESAERIGAALRRRTTRLREPLTTQSDLGQATPAAMHRQTCGVCKATVHQLPEQQTSVLTDGCTHITTSCLNSSTLARHPRTPHRSSLTSMHWQAHADRLYGSCPPQASPSEPQTSAAMQGESHRLLEQQHPWPSTPAPPTAVHRFCLTSMHREAQEIHLNETGSLHAPWPSIPANPPLLPHFCAQADTEGLPGLELLSMSQSFTAADSWPDGWVR